MTVTPERKKELLALANKVCTVFETFIRDMRLLLPQLKQITHEEQSVTNTDPELLAACGRALQATNTMREEFL